jgi:poly-gamma-glutamate capsule biosynthesis protein CapA/YwtB (metallophosphatase superfamily)
VTASTGSAAMGWPIRLFVCGDVMTGRGIDQILPHPSQPRLYEARVQSAVTYVELAEAASGPIGRALDPSYPWRTGPVPSLQASRALAAGQIAALPAPLRELDPAPAYPVAVTDRLVALARSVDERLGARATEPQRG